MRPRGTRAASRPKAAENTRLKSSRGWAATASATTVGGSSQERRPTTSTPRAGGEQVGRRTRGRGHARAVVEGDRGLHDLARARRQTHALGDVARDPRAGQGEVGVATRVHQTGVMEHRGGEEQLRVDIDPLELTDRPAEDVAPVAVVHQGRWHRQACPLLGGARQHGVGGASRAGSTYARRPALRCTSAEIRPTVLRPWVRTSRLRRMRRSAGESQPEVRWTQAMVPRSAFDRSCDPGSDVVINEHRRRTGQTAGPVTPGRAERAHRGR